MSQLITFVISENRLKPFFRFAETHAFALMIISNLIFSQQIETEKFLNLYSQQDIKPVYLAAKHNTNELQFVFSGLYLFYKHFISSQDHVSCVFYPSCSTYGMESIKKKGVIIGTFSAFDRLTRCHALSPQHYHLDPDTHLLLDPVK